MDMGDHFAQYEDDGAPVDRQDILDVQAQVTDMLVQRQAMMEMLQRHIVQPQAMAMPLLMDEDIHNRYLRVLSRYFLRGRVRKNSPNLPC